MMNNTIKCPECGADIPLDQTLAAPFIAEAQREAKQAIAEMEKATQEKEEKLRQREADQAKRARELAEKEQAVEDQVNLRLAEERRQIVEAERKKLEDDFAQLQSAEREKMAKMKEELEKSREVELRFLKREEELAAKEQAAELEIQRKLSEERKSIEDKAQAAADEKAKLQLAEKEKTIRDMQAKLEEAQRKGSQGSQQLQGEVLELDFEEALRRAFPRDQIDAVKTGQRGGDVLQRIDGHMGTPIGTIMWEMKRTTAWGGDWAAKAKEDARKEKAEAVVIVSQALPKGIDVFGEYEEVYVCRPEYALAVAGMVRKTMAQVAESRSAARGRETKKDLLYDYMIGPDFRAAIQGIAEPFVQMRSVLETEKRATLKRWKQQEKLMERVMNNVAGLQGDLKGIGGAEMPELPEFSEESIAEDEE